MVDKELYHRQQKPTLEENAHWGVAVIGCAALVFSAALFCTSGLFYVYFMESFGVNRETASRPATTMGVVLSVSGLLMTLLQRFLSVFEIGVIGSVFLWAGVLASAFVTRMELMAFCIGALHGLGTGLTENAMAVAIGTLFRKHRGLAMGVKDAGHTLSALIFPSVVSKLNAEYGLRGALLICGALLMNETALVLLLRRPQLTRRGPSSPGGKDRATKLPSSPMRGDDSELNVARYQGSGVSSDGYAGNYQSARELGQPSPTHRKHLEDNKPPIHQNKARYASEPLTFEDSTKINRTGNADSCSFSEGSEVLNTQRSARSASYTATLVLQQDSSSLPHKEAEQNDTRDRSSNSVRGITQNVRSRPCGYEVHSLLTDPIFYILVFQNTVMGYSVVVNNSISVDYARDKGVPTKHAELISTYAAATDLLLGHIAISFLSDRGYLKRSVLAALIFALLSAILVATTFTHGVAQFLPAWITSSFLVCAALSLSPLLITDFLGADRIPITYGTSGLIAGPLVLATPSITGFFRDHMGSYDNLVRLVGGLAALTALLLLWLPVLGNRNSSNTEQ